MAANLTLNKTTVMLQQTKRKLDNCKTLNYKDYCNENTPNKKLEEFRFFSCH